MLKSIWNFMKPIGNFIWNFAKSHVMITIIILVVATALITYGFSKDRKFEFTGSSIEVLIRETPIQLVTNRTTTMVYCTMADLPKSWLSGFTGTAEGILITKVRYSYGLDLKEDFSEKNIHIGDHYIEITLPEPKLLECAPDIDYTTITKTPLLLHIMNRFSSRDVEAEMRKVFQENMKRFAEENGLNPTKDAIIKIIEPYFNRILGNLTDKRIIFK